MDINNFKIATKIYNEIKILEVEISAIEDKIKLIFNSDDKYSIKLDLMIDEKNKPESAPTSINDFDGDIFSQIFNMKPTTGDGNKFIFSLPPIQNTEKYGHLDLNQELTESEAVVVLDGLVKFKKGKLKILLNRLKDIGITANNLKELQ